jgi:hypothetical protein
MQFQPISEEQIEAWKKEHGTLTVLNFSKPEGKVYFIDPNKSKNYFHMAKRAISYQQRNETIEAGEVIFNECYLGGLGDPSKIEKNTSIYINACVYCTQLIESLEAVFTTA